MKTLTLLTHAGRRGAAAAVLALIAVSGAPRPGHAQINTQPVITSLQTYYGPKNGVAAATANMSYTINGYNFSSIPTNNTVRLERKVIYNGVQTWSPVSSTNPTNATATSLTAAVGSVATGDYRVSVWVRDRGYSNYVALTIVSSATVLQAASPGQAKPGTTIILIGNLLPRIDARVVLTPPTEYAPYMGTREIVPTSVGAFNTTFVLPTDIWEGIWKIRIVGWDGGTNNIPFNVLVSVAPTYSVNVDSYKCFVETADGPGDDEPYLSTITYIKGSTNPLGLGYRGSYVTSGVHAGVVKSGCDLNYWYDDGYIIPGGHRLTDPTQASFIIGLAESDQWYLTGGFIQVWDHDQSRYEYAAWMANKVVTAAVSARNNGDSTLNSGDASLVSTWLKNKLYSVLNDGDDECMGVQIVNFSRAEMLKARSLNGQPYKKTLTMTGDGSKYEVYVSLRKTGGN